MYFTKGEQQASVTILRRSLAIKGCLQASRFSWWVIDGYELPPTVEHRWTRKGLFDLFSIGIVQHENIILGKSSLHQRGNDCSDIMWRSFQLGDPRPGSSTEIANTRLRRVAG